MGFVDRSDAGQRLGARLGDLQGKALVVLGLPRGGVPVAAEVARALGAPLDVILVRKLGVPFQPELGMGAIGEDGVRVVNDEVVRAAGVARAELESVEARERAELERRAERFRRGRPRLDLAGRTAVIVDDGLATGSTARAACLVARAHGASRVVLAVPVAPPGWEARIGAVADECVSLETPGQFFAIGQFYEDFAQVDEGEVVALLEAADRERAAVAAASGGTGTAGGAVGVGVVAGAAGAGEESDPPGVDEDVVVVSGPVQLGGHLTVPEGATGIVLFAHGSGSSRHSPRNRYVAAVLNDAGLGTLLFDLLTVSEEIDRSNVFDIELLAHRLVDATAWLRSRPEASGRAIGYFGASTGAGAALWAAADQGADVAAVVSRGGRPDLAGPRLADVSAPTLLIVGGHDDLVLELNRSAQAQMRCETRLLVVPGATHLFEEPGTLDAAAAAARDWFTTHLAPTTHLVG